MTFISLLILDVTQQELHSNSTEALEEGSMTALIMLDLSAAFDVIDHPILLKPLELSFGIKDKALTWVKSYLIAKTQCVSVSDKTSSDGLFGVTQGSVLGAKNCCMCTKPVGEIIKRYNIKYHCYADDKQVYMSLKSFDQWVLFHLQFHKNLDEQQHAEIE